MNILYKSSSFQTYFYYIIYPILICISAFFIFKMISYGDFGLFMVIMICIFIFVFISLIESLYALKYIKVTESCILIRTFKGEKIVEYKNILYVYNLVNIKGIYLILWYQDTETNKKRVIMVRPENEILLIKSNYSSYLFGKGEIEMTKYIKERAIKENPSYLNINNPRWFLFTISPTFLSK